MGIGRILGPTVSGLLLTTVCLAADRVEIVVDNSAAMWGTVGRDMPRIVALREALTAVAVSATALDAGLEIGVRMVGGHRDMIEDGVCDDTELLIPIGEVDPAAWREALADLFPRGGRPLVRAVRAAFADLSAGTEGRRIVIVTAGGDTCGGDLAKLLSGYAENREAVVFRVVGLAIDRQTADALTLVARTRNVTDVNSLLDSLMWAALPNEERAAKMQWLSLHVTLGGSPVSGAEIALERGVPDESWTAPIEAGAARIQLPAGRYRATITSPTFEPMEVAGINHVVGESDVDLELSAMPPVTLEVDPERPISGGHAFVQFWGAPSDSGWVTVALAESPLDSYLVRSPAVGPSGERALRLPDVMRELEVGFVRQSGQGVMQLLGRRSFQCSQGKASIDCPEAIENGTALQISWQGPKLPGDHITISGTDGSAVDDLLCIPADSGGPISVTAPIVPGAYEIRYLSSLGRALTRANLEVYEVLATLEAPTELSPGQEFTVEWVGPNAPQDYLSLSLPETENEAYIEWQPTASGSPLRLHAPHDPGSYEIRYVRASDDAVLAREPLIVVAVAVSLRVPTVVETGTRFDVEWSGTPGPGDFLAVAREHSDDQQYLDWSYTTLGSPLSLAAPFRPGRFEVLYVSGKDLEILAREPLKVRR